MSLPCITIHFIGMSCMCCSSTTEKNSYKVYFRADKDKFFAVPEEKALKTPTVVQSTIHAFDQELRKNYSIELSEIPVQLSSDDLPSVEEIRSIEQVAQRILRMRRGELVETD